jgi:AcrR family transcriptional regulator
MSYSLTAVEEAWADHVENLIQVAAKKGSAVAPKHRQIVEGACQVFFKKGFHPTSIRDIAEAAEMSTGQLYHYISSKDDVLFLIHKHMQIEWYRYITNSGIDTIDDPCLRFGAAMEATLKYLTENKKLIQFIYSESKYLNREHLRVVLAMDDRYVVRFWRELLQNLLGDDVSDNYIDFAGNVIGYLMVFNALRGWNLKSMSQQQVRKHLKNFVLQGLGLADRAEV